MTTQDANRRFIITGAPGAGKTTVLAELARRGYTVAPESPRAIIRRRLDAGLPPRPAPAEFAREVLDLDIATYATVGFPASGPILFDRGLVDALAAPDLRTTMTAADIDAHLDRYPFNPRVFLFPAWGLIYRTDAERDQTFTHASRVDRGIRRWYQRCGYELLEVPRTDVSARADFMESALRAALAD